MSLISFAGTLLRCPRRPFVTRFRQRLSLRALRRARAALHSSLVITPCLEWTVIERRASVISSAYPSQIVAKRVLRGALSASFLGVFLKAINAASTSLERAAAFSAAFVFVKACRYARFALSSNFEYLRVAGAAASGVMRSSSSAWRGRMASSGLCVDSTELAKSTPMYDSVRIGIFATTAGDTWIWSILLLPCAPELLLY